MKRFCKLSLLFCFTVLLSLITPVFAANITNAKKHQPPAADQISTIYAINQANQTYHEVSTSDWESIRNVLTLPTTPSQNENKNSKYVGGFCFVMKDGSQRIYTVSESQVLVGDTPLFASVANRAAAEKLSKDLCSRYGAQPAMLAYMNPDKITRVTLSGYGYTRNKPDPNKFMNMDFIVTGNLNLNAVVNFSDTLKSLRVAPSSTKIVSGHTNFTRTDDNMVATIEFSTGTVYHIEFLNSGMSIWSSDGTRTYTYDFKDYDPRKGSGTGYNLRSDMWDLYQDSSNYKTAAIFLTKPDSKQRTKGAFYAIEDGGLDTMVRLGQILDDIRVTTPLSRIQASTKPYLEIIAHSKSNGIIHFELDEETLTAYYYYQKEDKGRSVPIAQEDYNWIKSLLNGKERSNRTILLEAQWDVSPKLYVCGTTEALFGELFDSKEKDPDYQPYTTGKKPSYVRSGIDCWADTGSLTKTTVYAGGIMVQSSHLLPWTPAKYDASNVYLKISRIISYWN